MNNNSKENRKANLYVTLLVILMMIAVVVAIAGAVVRNVNTDAAETTKPVHKVQVTEKADTTAGDASSETKKDADRSDEFAEKAVYQSHRRRDYAELQHGCAGIFSYHE